MKNINLIIYSSLGLIIVVLIGALIYLEKNNVAYIERIAVLEKEAEFKAIEEDFFPSIVKDRSQQINSFLSGGNEDALNVFDDKTRYCGTEKEIVKSYLKSFLTTLEYARLKAQKASFKSNVYSTLPNVTMCIDENGFVNAPEKGKLICEQNKEKFWPDFDDLRASWGGCDFEIDKAKGTFKYCATFGETKVVCTQDGCNFLEN